MDKEGNLEAKHGESQPETANTQIKQWSRSTRYLVLVLMLAGAVWFVVYARVLVESLTIAALIAFFLNPLVSLVNRRIHLSRFWTIILVYLLTFAGLITLAIIFAPVIPAQTANLTNQLQIITEQIEQDYFSGPIDFLGFPIDLSPFQSELPTLDPMALARPDIILSAIRATSANVGWFAVILVTSFYLLQDWDKLRTWLFSWVPEGYSNDANRLYYEIQTVWNGYFRGQFRLSISVGLLTWIGVQAVGLPGAVIFGIAAGILDVILSVGPVLVALVAGMVALFAGSNLLPISQPIFAIVVLGIFGLIQLLENVWLRPRIMANNVNMHPALVFIAIIASLALAGVLTALFIIPVLASTGVIARYLYSRVFELDPWEKHIVQPTSKQAIKKTAVAPKTSQNHPKNQ